ncbi:MAG: cupredoxin domain-containing protein [Deltaproteobacteria bacterium]|nr:cupredoxin domain-containing protein [Deltaproteobacteria bacterium]
MQRLHFSVASLFFALTVSLSAIPAAGTGVMAVAGGTPAAAVTAPPGHRGAGFVVASANPAAKAASVIVVEPPFQSPMTWNYQSAVLKVRAGTTVIWTNTGAVLHTVTAADRKSFNSKDIRPKGTFSWTFKKAGTFAYFCNYHPWMKGTVIVER